VRIRVREMDMDTRIRSFACALEALSGNFYQASSQQDACAYVARLIDGKVSVASNAPYLEECGITGIDGVQTGFTDELELRRLSATADFGITSADYALADTGTLVMLSSGREARMISLVPPVHIAVLPKDRFLTGLDDLFTVVPTPAEISSSMVLITGPSRTADIEQILIRGVHGPGELYVVVV
jgi:L-lactate utilization protein LutC